MYILGNDDDKVRAPHLHLYFTDQRAGVLPRLRARGPRIPGVTRIKGYNRILVLACPYASSCHSLLISLPTPRILLVGFWPMECTSRPSMLHAMAVGHLTASYRRMSLSVTSIRSKIPVRPRSELDNPRNSISGARRRDMSLVYSVA
jgi:hypothetical protein